MIRTIAREGWADRLPLLMDIADGAVPIRLKAKCEHCGQEPSAPLTLEDVLKVMPDTADRLRAMDQLARYGLGTTKELTVEHIRERLKEQISLIQASFPPDVAEKIIRVIEPVWKRKA